MNAAVCSRRGLAAICFCLSVLAFEMVCAAQGERRRPNDIDQWINAIDKSLDQPALKLATDVAILPATDENKAVMPGGRAIQLIANSMMRYNPRRRMAGSAMLVYWLSDIGGYGAPGRVLSADDVKVFTSACGTTVHAQPVVKSGPEGYELTVLLGSTDGRLPAKTVIHKLVRADGAKLPGLIARDCLEYVGQKLTQADQDFLADPQLKSFDDLLKFDKLLDNPDKAAVYWGFRGMVEANPKCPALMAIWPFRVTEENLIGISGMIKRLKPDSQDAQMGICWLLPKRSAAGDAMDILTNLAADHRGDSFVYYLMLQSALTLWDDRLVNHVMNAWEANEPGYAGSYLRGRFMVSYAWDARGGGWAFQVTRKGWEDFDARLQVARDYLVKAVEANPQDFLANAELIRVAMGLNQDTNIMEGNFERAAAANPLSYEVYRVKFNYLMPRWHGEPETLIHFGQTCLDKKLWPSRIPMLFHHALVDVARRDETTGQRFADEELWKSVELFREWVHKHGSPDDARAFDNRYAFLATLSGRYTQAAAMFRTLAPLPSGMGGFFSRTDREFFKDVAFAQAGTPAERALPLVRRAMDIGDWRLADKRLAEAIAAGAAAAPADQANRLKRAIALCRKFQEDKSLDLDPQTILDTFTVSGGKWNIENGKLVGNIAANESCYITSPFGATQFEIAGTFNWDGPYSPSFSVNVHTRSMADRRSLLWTFPVGRAATSSVMHGAEPVARPRTYKNEAQKFTITLAGNETFSPSPDIVDTLESGDARPGGFEFFCECPSRLTKGCTLYLSNVKIKLLKGPSSQPQEE